jgi:hypothetical protein
MWWLIERNVPNGSTDRIFTASTKASHPSSNDHHPEEPAAVSIQSAYRPIDPAA